MVSERICEAGYFAGENTVSALVLPFNDFTFVWQKTSERICKKLSFCLEFGKLPEQQRACYLDSVTSFSLVPPCLYFSRYNKELELKNSETEFLRCKIER